MQELVKLPEGAEFIIKTLKIKGFEAYAVGGCIRDSLLMKNPDDWDITTSAEPDFVLSVFKKAGCTVVPTGMKHGTVTVIYKKKHYEVTTYRIDGLYADGRRPESVCFTSKLEEDLNRRDFTINAMAYSRESGLIDFFDGFNDLKGKMIRCVGNADERFSEDYLRMLRAYRFVAVLSFEIDTEAYESIKRNKQKITCISAERIRVEFEKMIINGCMDGIYLFFDDFLDVIIPEINGNDIASLKNIFRNTDRNLCVRLSAVLCGLDAGTAREVLKRLKYDNKMINSVYNVLEYKDIPVSLDKAEIKKTLFLIGEDSFRDLNELQKAVYTANKLCSNEIFDKRMDLLNEIMMNKEPFLFKDLAITGNEIMNYTGEKPGAAIGIKLKRLLDMVIVEPGLNSREKLLEIVANDRG